MNEKQMKRSKNVHLVQGGGSKVPMMTIYYINQFRLLDSEQSKTRHNLNHIKELLLDS